MMNNSCKHRISRRSALKHGALVAAAVPLALVTRSALAQKVPQGAVAYVDQSPTENNCGGCMHFEADAGTCKLVDGEIKAQAWCSLWSPKG